MKKTSVRNPFESAFALSRIAVAPLLLILLTVSSLHAASAPPERMAYQGYLVDGNGSPLAPNTPLNYQIVFRFYDVQDGGTSLWSEKQVVTVDKGSFSVVLGEGVAMPGELHDSLSKVFSGSNASERYMGITVLIGQNWLPLLPRLQMLSSPYAFFAREAVQLINPSSGVPFITLVGGETTISNNTHFGGTVIWGSSLLDTANGGSMELGNSQAASATPYIDFHYGKGAAQDYNVRLVNDADGRLSLYGGRLSLGSSLANTKIALWESGGVPYGLGVQSGQFRLHLDTSAAKFSFLNAPAGTEVVTIRGDGKVGIGNSFPSTTLDISSSTQTLPLSVQGSGDTLRIVAGTISNRGAIGARKFISYYLNGFSVNVDSWYDLVVNGEFGSASGNVLIPGKVGIGTATPVAQLDVKGYGTYNKNYTVFTTNTHGTAVIGTTSTQYSILADNNIGAHAFHAFSDARFKNVLGVSNGEKDLETIRQLRVKDYYLVDKVPDGGALKKGFIAQEVREIIPDAVTSSRRFIPDIYAVPEAFEYDASNKQLTITLAKPHPLVGGDRLQIFVDDARLELQVSKVLSPRKFILDNCELKPLAVFAYGKEISDFLALNYDQIFTTGISAIQELHRIVESKNAQIASLNSEIAALKRQIGENLDVSSRLEARFTLLEELVTRAAKPSLVAESPKHIAAVGQ